MPDLLDHQYILYWSDSKYLHTCVCFQSKALFAYMCIMIRWVTSVLHAKSIVG